MKKFQRRLFPLSNPLTPGFGESGYARVVCTWAFYYAWFQQFEEIRGGGYPIITNKGMLPWPNNFAGSVPAAATDPILLEFDYIIPNRPDRGFRVFKRKWR